jgi:IS30 family transposase
VSREVARHGDRPAYRAHDADRQAGVSALRPKKCLLARNPKLRNIVASKMILDWSPEQISGWLKTHYPDDENMRVSKEVGVFVRAAPPGTLRIAEIDLHIRSDRKVLVSGHLQSAIPRQRAPQGNRCWHDRRNARGRTGS